MDDEKNILESQKVEETKNSNGETTSSYKPTTKFTTSSKSESTGFGRKIVTPFICGSVGAALVIGVCFGIPNVKNTILGYNSSSNSSTNNSTSSIVNNSFINLEEYSKTSTSVAAKVLPSVVGIRVEFPVNSIFSKNNTTASASGSGIIISKDGYILTNNHIVDSSTSTSSSFSFYEVGEASKVEVYLYNDETAYEAKIIGTDKQTDLAVIKIDKNDLTAAEIGDSDSLQIGEFAMTIGNPLGLKSSVCTGVISAVNREITTEGVTYTLVQTDAAINSGNSGGALVNSKGQIIGINTMKISYTGVEGMGFAIPVSKAKPIYEQLIEYKKVKRPYIGINGRDLSESLAKSNNLPVGIYITYVEEFSAAEKAGLKIGDVIISIDGQEIKTMDELNKIKNSHSIGDTIKIKYSRNNEEKEVDITLQEE